jgi:hypothetical protein
MKSTRLHYLDEPATKRDVLAALAFLCDAIGWGKLFQSVTDLHDLARRMRADHSTYMHPDER